LREVGGIRPRARPVDEADTCFHSLTRSGLAGSLFA
jgi:hypothetical protein